MVMAGAEQFQHRMRLGEIRNALPMRAAHEECGHQEANWDEGAGVELSGESH